MGKVLVAYFSATGRTKARAEQIAAALGADLHEIVPEVPYSKKDLMWWNPLSRTTREMNNKKFRPPIVDVVEDMDQYDIILLGFPIWWFVAPTVVNTFLEKYPMRNKKIGIFATSGGSGFGSTISKLQASVSKTVQWEQPMLLNEEISDDEIRFWVQGMM